MWFHSFHFCRVILSAQLFFFNFSSSIRKWSGNSINTLLLYHHNLHSHRELTSQYSCNWGPHIGTLTQLVGLPSPGVRTVQELLLKRAYDKTTTKGVKTHIVELFPIRNEFHKQSQKSCLEFFSRATMLHLGLITG